MLDLSRPCDACGKMIGGGFKYCPKCQIYFCFTCWIELMYIQGKLPLEETSLEMPSVWWKAGIEFQFLKKHGFFQLLA
jgi:hypothetical protein